VRRWALGAVSLFVAGITGCLTPSPRVDTPANTPPASQKVTPAVASGAQASPKGNGLKLLTPTLGEMQKISGAPPQFPEELRHAGSIYIVSAKICVSNAGVVDSVSILAGNQPALATNVVNAVKDWRFTPLTVNGGAAVPFCYLASFEFKAV
jgi:TonB family protein